MIAAALSIQMFGSVTRTAKRADEYIAALPFLGLSHEHCCALGLRERRQNIVGQRIPADVS